MTAGAILETGAAALIIAFAIDQLFGELPAPVHPVVWIGTAGRLLGDRVPRRPDAIALMGGTLIALALPVFAFFAAFRLMTAAGDSVAGRLLEALLLTSTFAVRALDEAVASVQRALEAGDLDFAHAALRALCSRDPSKLDASEVSAAAIESVAENASDSIVAPLFYYSLLGVPGALAYRAINTLDAVLGYRGELEYVGKACARLDDLANLLPARLTALLLLVAAAGRGQGTRAVRTWRAAARLTESPNAGHPMAMMAGLLGVRLSKAGAYVLGAGLRLPGAADVATARVIVTRGAWLTLVLSLLARWLRGSA